MIKTARIAFPCMNITCSGGPLGYIKFDYSLNIIFSCTISTMYSLYA